MAALLGAIVLSFGPYRVAGASGAGQTILALAVATYLVWIALEAKWVSLREPSLPDAPKDRGTCELYGISQGATVLAALLLVRPWIMSLAAGAVGLLLLVAGAAIRLAAIWTLGPFYSRRVRLMPHHRLVATGPYAWVRHPAYLGTLLGHLGFVLVFYHWAALALWALLFLPLVIWRIRTEEPVLFGLEGYREYAAEKKRLVPWVW